jgi:hypothetical protein
MMRGIVPLLVRAEGGYKRYMHRGARLLVGNRGAQGVLMCTAMQTKRNLGHVLFVTKQTMSRFVLASPRTLSGDASCSFGQPVGAKFLRRPSWL